MRDDGGMGLMEKKNPKRWILDFLEAKIIRIYMYILYNSMLDLPKLL